VLVCYGCGQQGHTRPNCPALANGGNQARPLATNNPPLRITDGHTGSAQPPKATGRVFHLSAEKAQTTPDVVTGTVYFFVILFQVLYFIFIVLVHCIS